MYFFLKILLTAYYHFGFYPYLFCHKRWRHVGLMCSLDYVSYFTICLACFSADYLYLTDFKPCKLNSCACKHGRSNWLHSKENGGK